MLIRMSGDPARAKRLTMLLPAFCIFSSKEIELAEREMPGTSFVSLRPLCAGMATLRNVATDLSHSALLQDSSTSVRRCVETFLSLCKTWRHQLSARRGLARLTVAFCSPASVRQDAAPQGRPHRWLPSHEYVKSEACLTGHHAVER